MKTKMLMLILGAMALTALPACQTETRYVTTEAPAAPTGLAAVAQGPGETVPGIQTPPGTRTVRAW